MPQKTEVITASATRELARRIYTLRHPNKLGDYEKALKVYEKALAKGGHNEITGRPAMSLFGETIIEGTGYNVIRDDGHVEFVARPTKPTCPPVYYYSRYRRDHCFGEMVTHATHKGLLADSAFNREIRNDRVEQYKNEMRAGRWRDLLSDPITITADGQVLNGQHRIAAATSVDWTKVDNDPAFLIVWDVDPVEAQFADGSRRTARDEKVIASKLLAVSQ
jgi:hypothetical protein